MSKHPFLPKKGKKAESKEAIQAKIEEVTAQASKCLANADFKRYSTSCKELQEALLVNIMSCDISDPVKYAFAIKSFITAYTYTSMMLEAVEFDKEVA